MKGNTLIPIYMLLAVFLFSSCGGGSGNSERKDTVSITATKAVGEIKGKAMFEQKCAACHGSDGTAGIANAANLRITKLDSIAVVSTISKGKNNMPAFGSQLTPEEIENIARYVMTLRK